ncbi:hypothetical protein BH23ACT7_BH23ACT7_17280 [soil metagenome]|jgi:putative oxidoreductase
MRALSLSPLHRLSAAAPVVLRVVTGLVFVAHGWQKLTQMGPAGFGNDMLAGLGVPAPVFFGYAVTFLELVGGVLLIVGGLSRIIALLLAIMLVVATLLVKVDLGIIAPSGSPLPGAELDLALIAALLGVVLLGPGRPSVDHAVGIEDTVPVAATPTAGTGIAARR